MDNTTLYSKVSNACWVRRGLIFLALAVFPFIAGWVCGNNSEYVPIPFNKGIDSSLISDQPVLFEDYTVGGVTFRMILVEEGQFLMGATSEQESDAESNEKPVHIVTLSSYFIGETEVTQALWEEVMGSNPSSYKGRDFPVESVNWKECQEFVDRLNARTGACFRIPTEAEWEYAARGGKNSKGYKYSGSHYWNDVGWCDDLNGTHPVRGKSPNELGIFDMSGNVMEWCYDFFGSYNMSSQTNPRGAESGKHRVVRGGYYNSYYRNSRVSCRYTFLPDTHSSSLGLRLAI